MKKSFSTPIALLRNSKVQNQNVSSRIYWKISKKYENIGPEANKFEYKASDTLRHFTL